MPLRSLKNFQTDSILTKVFINYRLVMILKSYSSNTTF